MKLDKLLKYTDSLLSVSVNMVHQLYGNYLQTCLITYLLQQLQTLRYFVFTQVFLHHYKTSQTLTHKYKGLKKFLMKDPLQT